MRDWYRDPKSDPDARENRERPQHKKKNTRRWCKGKEGREHHPEIVFDNRYRSKCDWAPEWATRFRRYPTWWCHHIEKCTVCGKHLRHVWELKAEECPDYQRLMEE